jgi:hypothetical protein
MNRGKNALFGAKRGGNVVEFHLLTYPYRV